MPAFPLPPTSGGRGAGLRRTHGAHSCPSLGRSAHLAELRATSPEPRALNQPSIWDYSGKRGKTAILPQVTVTTPGTQKALAHLAHTTKAPFLTTELSELITVLPSEAKLTEASVFLFLSEPGSAAGWLLAGVNWFGEERRKHPHTHFPPGLLRLLVACEPRRAHRTRLGCLTDGVSIPVAHAPQTHAHVCTQVQSDRQRLAGVPGSGRPCTRVCHVYSPVC